MQRRLRKYYLLFKKDRKTKTPKRLRKLTEKRLRNLTRTGVKSCKALVSKNNYTVIMMKMGIL